MESKRVLLKNLNIDITDIIQREIYAFVKREPAQIENIDYSNSNSSCRFHRGAMISAGKIVDHLKSNNLIRNDDGE